MIQYKNIELYMSRLLIFTFNNFMIMISYVSFFASLYDDYKGSIANAIKFDILLQICSEFSGIFKKELL